MKKRLTIFDFDGTLIQKNSLFEFAKFAIGKRRCLLATIRSIPNIALWKLGLNTNSHAKESLIRRFYRGMGYSYLSQKGEEFALVINSMLRTDIYDKMIQYIHSGDRVIIISASLRFWIEPWARQNGIDMVIATEPEINEQGLLTGRFATPNCHGTEKAMRLNSAIPDLHDYYITAYGDSAGDNAIFKLADKSYRV